MSPLNIRVLLTFITAGCVVLGIVCTQPALSPGKVPVVPSVVAPSVSPPCQADLQALRLQMAHDRIRHCLEEYQNRMTSLRGAALKRVRDDIQSRKSGIKALVSDLLGWKSKGLLIWSCVPWTNPNAHADYIRSKFAEHVFAEEYVQELLSRTLKGHEKELMDLRNEMLLQLRIDLEDFEIRVPESQSVISIEHQMRSYVQHAERQTMHSGAKDLLMLSLSFKMAQPLAEKLTEVIMSRLAQVLASRLTTSGVILGTGAAGSITTLGLTLVIAIAIDAALEWIVGWFYDPAAELEKQLAHLLDEIANSILAEDQEFSLTRVMQQYDAVHLKALGSSLVESVQLSSPARGDQP